VAFVLAAREAAGAAEFEHAWFVFEFAAHDVVAHLPEFGNFSDREMTLKRFWTRHGWLPFPSDNFPSGDCGVHRGIV